MKICIISNLYEPYIIGGAEIVAAELAKKISLKHEVVVMTTTPQKGFKVQREIFNGVRVIRFYPLNLYNNFEFRKQPTVLKPFWHGIDIWNVHTYLTVRQTLIEEKPDLIHTHNISGLSPSVWSAAASLKIPIVHTLHDYSLLCSKTTLLKNNGDICDLSCLGCCFFRIFKKQFSKAVNAVISPSRFVLDMLVSNNFFPEAKKHVVFYGIELQKHEKRSLTNKNDITFLYIGQLEKHKGIEVLLKAFLKLSPKNLSLHIAGTGSMKEKIKEAAEKDKRIKFHGFVEGDAKKKLFLSSNILIVPSIWYENSPKVIYEAYSFGLPVLGSRIGGIPELIDHEKTGFLFESCSSNDLQSTMANLIEDPGLFEVLIQNCYKKAEIFSLENQVNDHLEIFNDLIKKDSNQQPPLKRVV